MYAARNVSTKEKELLEFCQLCLGYPVNPRIFRYWISRKFFIQKNLSLMFFNLTEVVFI